MSSRDSLTQTGRMETTTTTGDHERTLEKDENVALALAHSTTLAGKGDQTEDEREAKVDAVICPIARNASLMKELDVAEGNVADLLEVAAGALEDLAGIDSLDVSKVEDSTKEFLGLVSAVHECLSSKANLIRDYTPYPRSIYGPRKELELLHEKARFLRSTLASMSRDQLINETPPDTTRDARSSPAGIATATTFNAVGGDASVAEGLAPTVGSPKDMAPTAGSPKDMDVVFDLPVEGNPVDAAEVGAGGQTAP